MATVLALVPVACTSSTEPDTTVSSQLPTTVDAATTTTEDPLLRLAVPIDSEVLQGQLDNGLTYYIRANDSPGGRAELRLLVDAGSVQEDADQAGMAHFLEHMMFNGTEQFPRNELVAALESFGPRFGPDINAHTTYDETVYELSLPTDETLIDLGMAVLREWATNATLTDPDVTEERGVVLDEWRLRAQGFSARVTEEVRDLIISGTPYEGHDPIGTPDSIQAASPDVVRRYYEDWYTPDRMAVVAVGDFDVAAMERRIVEAFGDVAAPGGVRTWEPVSFTPADAPVVGSHTDEEATSAEVSVMWPVSAGPIATVGEYQDSVLASMAVEILTQRLADDALSGEGPLLDASPIDLDWARAIGLLGVDAEIRPEQADQGLEAVLHEVERMRRHGITEEEFERALSAFEATIRQLFDTRATIQDTEFASQIAAHHLGGDPMMSPSQRFDVESDIAGRITREDVERALLAVMSRPPVVLALGPDDPGVEVPTEERILEVLDGLAQVSLEPREVPPDEPIDLMSPPTPAEVTRNTIHPEFLYTKLEFANGADVYLWESDIAIQGVYARVEGFGGTSVLPIDDLPEAFLVTDMVLRSGLGDLNARSLDRLLADRLVSVQPWISETRQGLYGNASSSDVETLMQLIHLTMTSPRLDAPAVDAVLDEVRNIATARDDLPGVVFEEAITRAYYGDDPRYFVVPTPDQLEAFDVAAAERVFRERFASAGDFAFVFVGDFDSLEMTDLAARYIGTLPGDPEPTAFVDNQPLPPREIQVATVEAGAGQQGQIGLFFTNEHEPVLKDRVAARLVELVLAARLRERIREDLSATYSITALIDLQRDPDPFAEASIVSTGDPTGLEEISEEILADLRSLQTEGPTEAQFETAMEQLRNELELIDNQTIADALVTAHLYPDQPVTELAARYPLLDEMTPADVQSMAAIAFNPNQRIEVRQIPRP